MDRYDADAHVRARAVHAGRDTQIRKGLAPGSRICQKPPPQWPCTDRRRDGQGTPGAILRVHKDDATDQPALHHPLPARRCAGRGILADEAALGHHRPGALRPGDGAGWACLADNAQCTASAAQRPMERGLLLLARLYHLRRHPGHPSQPGRGTHLRSAALSSPRGDTPMDFIKIERADDYATIRLTRPEKRNSINNQMLTEFEAALTAVERDPAVRALVPA